MIMFGESWIQKGNGSVEPGEPKNRFTVYPIIKAHALDATYTYT